MKKQTTPPKIAFVSTMTGSPWGGSEELWYRTAKHLKLQGGNVVVSVNAWTSPAKQIDELRSLGIPISERYYYPKSVVRRMIATISRRVSGKQVDPFSLWLQETRPDLCCFSDGGQCSPIGMLAACVHHKIKFVCLSQCGFENAWIPDSEINEWQSTLHQCSAYFAVSRSSLRWAREHFAMELPSPRVVRNPVNVSYKPCLEWPESKSSGFTNMACVARLDLAAKGQDILLNVLASPKWQNREWRLNFYGDGPNKKAIDFLVRSLGLENRVKLHGRVGNVESIWKENQLLVMPSRFEGLPLALVEAQLCGRPAVLTPASGDCESVIDGVTAYLSESTASRHIDAALDRAWLDKANWQEIGQRAAKAIRSTVPEHPEIDFANLLIDIAGSEKL